MKTQMHTHTHTQQTFDHTGSKHRKTIIKNRPLEKTKKKTKKERRKKIH